MTERDPNGKSAHEAGSKLDDGKVDFGMLMEYFPRAFLEVAKVANYGARKYTRGGWETVPDGIVRYTAAMYRHLLYEQTGEMHDKDTDLLHAAHAAWNAMAVLELKLRDLEAFSDGELSPYEGAVVLYEEAERRKQVELAYVNGFSIEFKNGDCDWQPCLTTPCWHWSDTDYRVAPPTE